MFFKNRQMDYSTMIPQIVSLYSPLSPLSSQGIQSAKKNVSSYLDRSKKIPGSRYFNNGRLSFHRNFLDLLNSGMIHHCPITTDDVSLALKCYSQELGSLYRKTTRISPPILGVDYVQIALYILRNHRNLTLEGDLIFVNNMPFLISRSH